MRIQTISPNDIEGHLPRLAAILHDCVSGGASVGFMHPFRQQDGLAFFEKVAVSVRAGQTVLFGAFQDDGALIGTVQLGLDGPCNQRHRADVKKLLVHRSARGRGAGASLMQAAEEEAARRGLILLVLDTVTGSYAEQLYTRLGWTKSGVIPNYAKMPDGPLCSTTVFWKAIGA